ncbi:hypothetical protein KTO58_17465 [Chitinophaga pendula]|uniref:hypothetical protein n=1 Tax=Chitinophaga TaxID=79328 RepID=UPI000BAFB8F2|nr:MULTISPECIES: hypothetical protein [Chitinophaga]ASZ11510.1 hypothetical protein CK934_11360 [Chitinophaga sp. MD30]UCJ05478.1 hypothetical protein KTO58_17465 [Chitinophaga pendula]
MKRFLAALVIIIATASSAAAQQEFTPPVLPEFSALIKTGKIQLDWISGFVDVRQIGVQRSLDSVLNFNTIGYAAAPNESRNVYLDNKPLPGTNYYRLFVLFNNGRYLYSKTILAVPDSTISATQKLTLSDIKDAVGANNKDKEPEKIAWRPSNYIYTTADGNVNIRLPEAPQKKYTIKFYEPNGVFLFEVEEVKEPFMILEKAIFLHSGWFNFELFEDGKLKEKWSLFIPLNYRT